MKSSNNNLLWKYAGFATQLIIALGLAVYIGLRIDEKLAFKQPLSVWVLPLVVIVVLIYKVIKDTSVKK